jgi:hypothetical protein
MYVPSIRVERLLERLFSLPMRDRHTHTHTHTHTHSTKKSHTQTPLVVNSRAFFLFFPCNHIINIKKKYFFGEAKDSVILSFFILLHKRAKPIKGWLRNG